jgi:hypothetical protein
MRVLNLTLRLSLILAAAALSGCAALSSVSSDVSSFGEWPADRKPGTYAFDRLPSQAQKSAESDMLETAAKPALAKAGFKPVEAGQQPDVLVQVGSRVGYSDAYPWADSLWWRGSFGYYRHGPWLGPRWGVGWGMQYDARRYEREVAVLIRDRASGKPLYESRASRESPSPATAHVTLGAMFEAALMDFPKLGMNPRRVEVALPQ